MKKYVEILGQKEVERVKEISGINSHMIFDIKFLSCTNTKGDRIRIKNTIKKETVIISYNYALPSNYVTQAALYIAACGYEIIGSCENLIIAEWNGKADLTF